MTLRTRAVRIDHDVDLRRVFPLLPERFTYAIAGGSNVWERDGCGNLTETLRGALDLRLRNIPIFVEVHGAITQGNQYHVKDERGTSL
jgi:hypothetical protein